MSGYCICSVHSETQIHGNDGAVGMNWLGVPSPPRAHTPSWDSPCMEVWRGRVSVPSGLSEDRRWVQQAVLSSGRSELPSPKETVWPESPTFPVVTVGGGDDNLEAKVIYNEFFEVCVNP